MRSHEARPSSVPLKLELWGRGQSTLLSPSQNFGGDSPSLSPSWFTPLLLPHVLDAPGIYHVRRNTWIRAEQCVLSLSLSLFRSICI